METATGNQNGSATQQKAKTIFGIPCGCDNRKEILGLAEWQNDAMVLGAVLLFAIGIFLLARKVESE